MSKSSNSGISFGGLLFLLFLALKLTDHIHWSWWWVTSPLWLPITVVMSIIGIVVFIQALVRK